MNLYVSPTGNDTWRGALLKANADKSDGPLATPAGAVRRLRALKERGGLDGPVTILLRGRTYRFAGPLIITAADAYPVTFRAYRDEKPVFSGGERIAGCLTPSFFSRRALSHCTSPAVR